MLRYSFFPTFSAVWGWYASYNWGNLTLLSARWYFCIKAFFLTTFGNSKKALSSVHFRIDEVTYLCIYVHFRRLCSQVNEKLFIGGMAGSNSICILNLASYFQIALQIRWNSFFSHQPSGRGPGFPNKSGYYKSLNI